MPDLTPTTPFYLGVPTSQTQSLVPSDIKLVPTYVRQTPLIEELSQAAPTQDPTKPYMDLDFESAVPVVQVFRKPIFDSSAPCWGFNDYNVGDLNVYGGARSTVIKAVTVDTKSTSIDMGVNHIDVAVLISEIGSTCDLNIYEVDAINGDVLMKSWVGVTRFVDNLFIGGQDGIALAGAQTKFEIVNITGGATVTVNIEGH